MFVCPHCVYTNKQVFSECPCCESTIDKSPFRFPSLEELIQGTYPSDRQWNNVNLKKIITLILDYNAELNSI